jgi:AcrR family transcriptional regulator
MPKGFTDHEKELIGKRLLEQGYRQFSAHGLKKTTVEELAAAAGISKGAFYLFYGSKEALFMDVIEQVEKNIRQQILAVIDLPGPSPRARLLAILKKAYTVFGEMPILQFVTGSDYDLLFRRIPQEALQEHLRNDRAFIEEMVSRCQNAGISIRVSIEQIIGVLYLLVLSMLHQEDLDLKEFSGSMDVLLELAAAFFLGEIELQVQNPMSSTRDSNEVVKNELAD